MRTPLQARAMIKVSIEISSRLLLSSRLTHESRYALNPTHSEEEPEQ